jgi:thiol-disulfide isomerase/thioredoxin
MAGAEAGTPPTEPADGATAGGPDTAPGADGAPGSGPRRPRPVFLAVGVVIAVALGIGLFTGIGVHHTPDRPTSGRPQPGDLVPTFSLPRLGGGAPVGVPADGGGHGRPAVVIFFASWCSPCRAEIPALAATYHLQQSSHSRLARVALIGVDANDTSPEPFVRQSGVTFPVGSDRNSTVTNGRFAFIGLPEAVFVNPNGTVAAVHYGALSTTQLVQWQRRLLTSG